MAQSENPTRHSYFKRFIDLRYMRLLLLYPMQSWFIFLLKRLLGPLFIRFFSLDCGFDVHKKYVHKVEELCVGPSTPSTTSSSVSGVAKKGDKKGLFGIGRILSERDLPSNRKASVQGKTCSTSKQSHYIFIYFQCLLLNCTIWHFMVAHSSGTE